MSFSGRSIRERVTYAKYMGWRLNHDYSFYIFILYILNIIRKTIILPIVLYGCETWALILREESRLRVFENRILRRIFWPKRDENGEWRRLHNE